MPSLPVTLPAQRLLTVLSCLLLSLLAAPFSEGGTPKNKKDRLAQSRSAGPAEPYRHYIAWIQYEQYAFTTNSGLLDIRVTERGSFSGSVFLAGLRLPIRGVIEPDGSALFLPARTKNLSLDRTLGGGSLTIGTISFEVPSPGSLTGRIERPSPHVEARFSAAEAPYHRGNPIPGDPAPGLYNLAFENKRLTQNLFAHPVPPGLSNASMRLSSDGTITMTGYLVNGVKFQAATKLRADNTFAFFAQPIRATSKNRFRWAVMFGGDMAFNNLPDSDLAGTRLLFLSVAPADTHHYALRVGVLVNGVGTQFDPAVSFDFGQGEPVAASGNSELLCEEGALYVPWVFPMNVDPANGLARTLPTNIAHTFSMDRQRGTFSGSFRSWYGHLAPYRGVILSKGRNRGGFGYFINKPPVGYTYASAGYSGIVTLQPAARVP